MKQPTYPRDFIDISRDLGVRFVSYQTTDKVQ